jgi:hypothetical protein
MQHGAPLGVHFCPEMLAGKTTSNQPRKAAREGLLLAMPTPRWILFAVQVIVFPTMDRVYLCYLIQATHVHAGNH